MYLGPCLHLGHCQLLADVEGMEEVTTKHE